MANLTHCYSCEVPLTVESASLEHVFPNSIGGRLKGRLLCRKCNSDLGGNADAELAECMNFFANFLDIRRDHGSPQPIEGVIESTGEKILRFPDGTARHRDPKIKTQRNGDQFTYEIRASNRREVEKHLRNIKRKRPKLDLDAARAAIKEEPRESNQIFRSTLDFGARGLLRSVTKIAVNFFLSVGGERSQISHLLPYIRSGESEGPTWYFEPDLPIFDEYDRDIFHSILLVGSSKERYLYAVVQLFSVTRYAAELNANYCGPDMLYRHDIDPVSGNSVNRDILRIPPSEEIKAALSIETPFPLEKVIKRTDRFLNIAYSKVTTRKKLKAIAESAFRENPPGHEDVQTYMKKIWKSMEPALFPMIQAAGQARREEAERRFKRSLDPNPPQEPG